MERHARDAWTWDLNVTCAHLNRAAASMARSQMHTWFSLAQSSGCECCGWYTEKQRVKDKGAKGRKEVRCCLIHEA